MTHPPTLACGELIALHDGEAHLQGGQCGACGELYFPMAHSCTRCLSTQLHAHDLGRHGTLWSWTIQQFLPKAPYDSGETPETFRPYGVGYVEMAGGIKVEARLTESDPQRLAIGMPLELVLIPYRRAADGSAVHTYAFAPAAVGRAGDTGESHA
jgi:uncharacterized OB-fold protein